MRRTIPIREIFGAVAVLAFSLQVDFAIAERILIEAEKANGFEKPVAAVSGAKEADKTSRAASGGGYLDIPQGAGGCVDVGGTATYEIVVPKNGEYTLWIRAWWLDSCGNSIAISIDGGPKRIIGNDRTYKRWHWVKCRAKLKLEKGKRTLTLANREDGVKIDQLLFTTDPEAIPVDIETP